MFDAPDMFAASVGGVLGLIVGAVLIWNYKSWFQNLGSALANVKADAETAVNDLKSEVSSVEAKFEQMKQKVVAVKTAIEQPSTSTTPKA